MKPGYRTTEFWVVMVTNVAVLADNMAGGLPPKYAAAAIAFSTAAYALARGIAKVRLP